MIIIGADHAGFDLKNNIIKYFNHNKISYLDVTNYNINNDDDYTKVAIDICGEVLKDDENIGIAICGTGIGISVACNKIKGIIATNCYDEYTVKMAKNHNNSNVLCLGGRLEYAKDLNLVYNMIKIYIESQFLGERHLKRVEKIKKLEENFGGNLWE